MKKGTRILIPVIFLLTLFLAGVGVAQEPGNTMHPKFKLLDETGSEVRDFDRVSTTRTCGQCHDTEYINRHNLHFGKKVKADCQVCHFSGGRLAGSVDEVHTLIRQPGNEHCGQCHGLAHMDETPLVIPGDYAANPEFTAGKRYYGMTQETGVIMAPGNLSDSALNLENKKNLDFPWDVHTRRQLSCISCHFTRNNLRYCGNINNPLGHLLRDPRKIDAPHNYLKRPNHDLVTASCSCCHDPFKVHKDMPYKERHMEVLDCQSCHVPELFGPAFRAVDETVVTPEGGARIEYRGINEQKSHGTSFNTRFLTGFQPFLFAYRAEEDKQKIAPFNLVTRWSWQSAKTGQPVPIETLKNIFLSGSGYSAGVVAVFDADKNGEIDKVELALDSSEKVEFIQQQLEAAGIEEPTIKGVVSAHKVSHGLMNTEKLTRNCSNCHSGDSNLGRDILLAAGGPAGILPEFAGDAKFLENGSIATGPGGEILLERAGTPPGRYIFGHSRLSMFDDMGFLVFFLSLAFILVHGGTRWIKVRKHPPVHAETTRVYMYRFYERFWHWTMAGAVIILALTGIEIHYAGNFSLFGLDIAVRIHNVIAAVLVINAFLSLFYHLTTGEIRQFFGFNRKFFQESVVQAYYYVSGIFRRELHPIEKTAERKLNPLQQLTYVILLNLLLPFQVITGILIWASGKWPFLSDNLGGLSILGPIHNLGSWLFLSFLAVHMYLTTTGHTVFSNIRAMVTGYDDLTPGELNEKQRKLLDMKVVDLVGTIFARLSRKKRSKKEE